MAGDLAMKKPSGGEFVVVSDPGGDPWDEGVFTTRSEAAAFVEDLLEGIARQGLDPDEWRAAFRIEQREGRD